MLRYGLSSIFLVREAFLYVERFSRDIGQNGLDAIYGGRGSYAVPFVVQCSILVLFFKHLLRSI